MDSDSGRRLQGQLHHEMSTGASFVVTNHITDLTVHITDLTVSYVAEGSSPNQSSSSRVIMIPRTSAA